MDDPKVAVSAVAGDHERLIPKFNPAIKAYGLWNQHIARIGVQAGYAVFPSLQDGCPRCRVRDSFNVSTQIPRNLAGERRPTPSELDGRPFWAFLSLSDNFIPHINKLSEVLFHCQGEKCGKGVKHGLPDLRG